MALRYDTVRSVALDTGWAQWPRLKEVLDYWDRVRGSRFAPPWTEFELTKLPLSLVPSTLVADYDSDRDDLKFRFWGTAMVSIFRMEITGRYIGDLECTDLFEPLMAGFREIRRTGKPLLTVNEVHPENKPPILSPVLRLPLSDDGKAVDGVVAVNDFGLKKRELMSFFEKQDAAQSVNA